MKNHRWKTETIVPLVKIAEAHEARLDKAKSLGILDLGWDKVASEFFTVTGVRVTGGACRNAYEKWKRGDYKIVDGKLLKYPSRPKGVEDEDTKPSLTEDRFSDALELLCTSLAELLDIQKKQLEIQKKQFKLLEFNSREASTDNGVTEIPTPPIASGVG